jgi:hypothetical protein
MTALVAVGQPVVTDESRDAPLISDDRDRLGRPRRIGHGDYKGRGRMTALR